MMLVRYEFDKAATDQISTCHSRDYAEDSRALQSCLNASNLVPAIENGERFCRRDIIFNRIVWNLFFIYRLHNVRLVSEFFDFYIEKL